MATRGWRPGLGLFAPIALVQREQFFGEAERSRSPQKQFLLLRRSGLFQDGLIAGGGSGYGCGR